MYSITITNPRTRRHSAAAIGSVLALGLLSAGSARADFIAASSFTLSSSGGVAYIGGTNPFIDFNVGDQPAIGTATDTIATVVGQTYIISYLYETSGGSAQSITAEAFNASNSALLGSTFSTSTAIGVEQAFQFSFTATGTSSIIEFADYSGNNTRSEDSSISNVNVPEPASLSLLGAGLAGLGWLRRRRK